MFITFQFHIGSKPRRKFKGFTGPILGCGELESVRLIGGQKRSEHQQTHSQLAQHGELQ